MGRRAGISRAGRAPSVLALRLALCLALCPAGAACSADGGTDGPAPSATPGVPVAPPAPASPLGGSQPVTELSVALTTLASFLDGRVVLRLPDGLLP